MSILITTSRRPTRRVRSFCKELASVFPGSVYVNRGKMSLNEVLLEASARGLLHALVVNVRKGNPGRLDLYDVEKGKLKASLVCLGVKLAREMKVPARPLTKAAVAIEGEGELEALGKMLAEVLGLPLIRGKPTSSFATALMLSPRGGYLGAINFLDLSKRVSIGPLIRIKRLLSINGHDAQGPY